MSEDRKVELTDEELSNVTGGAGGNIPKGGITYSTYSSAFGGRFYARSIGGTDLIRTDTSSGFGYYYQETLTVDKVNNTWSTQTVRQLPGQPDNFYATYPYVLNIKPSKNS